MGNCIDRALRENPKHRRGICMFLEFGDKMKTNAALNG